MTDIVGNETLRSLWETMADRCADRDFMVFENRVGSVFEYTYAQFDPPPGKTQEGYRNNEPTNKGG